MKKSIVVIDTDVRLITDLKNGFLLDNNYEVIDVATTGNEGYMKVYTKKPDIVIIGTLFDVDIIKLINAITQVSPTTKKILTLDIENSMLSREYKERGADYVISKPYTIQNILELLEPNNLKSYQMDRLEDAFNNFGTSSNPNMINNLGGFGQTQQSQQPQMEVNSGFNSGFSQPQMSSPSNYNNYNTQMSSGFRQSDLGQQFPQNQEYQPLGQDFPQNNQGFDSFGQSNQQTQGFGQMGQSQGFAQSQNQGFGQSQSQMGQQGFGQPQMGAYRTIKQTILSIYSPKGGVGKTTLSKEMATAFAKVTINGVPLKVLLVDVDIEFGDVCSMFRLPPKPNVMDWKRDIEYRKNQGISYESMRFNSNEIEDRYLIKHPQSGLRILPAPSSHGDHFDFTRHDMKVILNNLKTCDFDIIILDLGNNTKDYTYTSLEESNQVLMVITMDLACLNDTNLLFGTLRALNFSMDKIKFVANKMPKSTGLDINIGDIEQTFGVSILEHIPENPNMRTVNNSGNPLVLSADNEYTKAVISLANKVVPVFGNTQRKAMNSGKGIGNKKVNTKKPNEKKSFIDKILGRK